MKKFKFLIVLLSVFLLCGCNEASSDNLSITTSVYPVEYVLSRLYNHGEIKSIYPKDTEALDYEVTDVLLEDYKDNDMFIFNGLSSEKKYVKTLLKSNPDLKIIDVTSNMIIDDNINELWLDPNNLLTIANNIKEGFEEYINQTVLKNEIEDNYESLKLDLTTIDSKYYSAAKKASNKTIIVSSDAFKYLEKYGLDVISIDDKTAEAKDISLAVDALSNGNAYIFVPYGSKDTKNMKKISEKKSFKKLELYTMTNLEDIDTTKVDYVTLSNQNLDQLKKELFK